MTRNNYHFKNLTSNYENRRRKKRSNRFALASAIFLALGTAGAVASSVYLGIHNRQAIRAQVDASVNPTAPTLESRTLQTEVLIPRNTPRLSQPSPSSVEPKKDKRKDYQYDDIIQKYCSANKLDFYRVKGLIYTESSFNPKARGKDGEMGLMQLKLSTAKLIDQKVTEADLENPEVNIRIGIEYLSKHFSRFQSADSALIAYNCGPNVFRKKKVLSNPIVIRYPTRIHHAMRVYQKGKSFFG